MKNNEQKVGRKEYRFTESVKSRIYIRLKYESILKCRQRTAIRYVRWFLFRQWRSKTIQVQMYVEFAFSLFQSRIMRSVSQGEANQFFGQLEDVQRISSGMHLQNALFAGTLLWGLCRNHPDIPLDFRVIVSPAEINVTRLRVTRDISHRMFA